MLVLLRPTEGLVQYLYLCVDNLTGGFALSTGFLNYSHVLNQCIGGNYSLFRNQFDAASVQAGLGKQFLATCFLKEELNTSSL